MSDSEEKWRGPYVDTRNAGIRKMVLVLEIDKLPTLYVESFLAQEKVKPLTPVKLKVEEGTSLDSTTFHNEVWRTSVPKPSEE